MLHLNANASLSYIVCSNRSQVENLQSSLSSFTTDLQTLDNISEDFVTGNNDLYQLKMLRVKIVDDSESGKVLIERLSQLELLVQTNERNMTTIFKQQKHLLDQVIKVVSSY